MYTELKRTWDASILDYRIPPPENGFLGKLFHHETVLIPDKPGAAAFGS